MQQPPLIKYNLKERGRQYRGQERNFNIKAICDAINSPSCQERVNTRAMLGYFGHKMRLLSGLEPQESVVIGGKYNEVEPAIVTTYLKASLDGTIEHQTEFLDNESGRRAARLFEQRIGGFSSAIDERRPDFAGFDYVLDPNYSTNRGFSLDSVSGLTFDSVLAEAVAEEEQEWLSLLEQKERENQLIKAALDSAQAENEQLLSMLASGNYSKESPVLDSVVTKHLMVDIDPAEQLRRDADLFKRANLIQRGPGFHPEDREYNTILNAIKK